jgi:cation transport ATPase
VWTYAARHGHVIVSKDGEFHQYGLLLSPMVASAAMTVSSVSVIGNALRLRRVALPMSS